MILARKEAFDKISRALAITRYDIEQRQQINDLSLNLHGENFFRDLFNDLYGLNYQNTNFESANAPCIDLLDSHNKIACQITTTRTKEKIEKTLKALSIEEYKECSIQIFYLLDKAEPQRKTIEELEENYSVDIKKILFDYNDLLKDINDLKEEQLIELCRKYFLNVEDAYTEHIALDLTIKHILRNRKKGQKDYDDDFGTIEVKKKFQLNELNERITAELALGLDYRYLLEQLETDNTLTELRDWVVNGLYRKLLLEVLLKSQRKAAVQNLKVNELHRLARELKCDFNKIIAKLSQALRDNIEFDDFNTSRVSWIIVSFFFELCDVGLIEKC